MKYSLSVVLALALIGGLVASIQAQQTRVYPFIELTDADLARIDLHDGSIDDWLDVLGEAHVTALDFESFEESYDPVDVDFRLWMGWHDATNRIYVAMERADDIYVNGFDRESGFPFMNYHDSGIDIMVDGDAGRDPRDPIPLGANFEITEEWYLLYARDSQWYSAIAETFDDGPHLQLINYHGSLPANDYGNWYEQPPYTEGGGTHFGERPTISITEFYITPFDVFVWNDPQVTQISDLFPGKLINFRIAIGDYEGAQDGNGLYTREGFYRLQGIGWPGWSDGLLLGPGGAIPEIEDTAVESVTWGRIKASFNKEIP